MARNLNQARLAVQLAATLRNVLDDDTIIASVDQSLAYQMNVASGTNANQADRAWLDKGREITSGGSATIDLADFAGEDIGGGDGNDGLGQALTLTEVAGVLIVNRSTSAGKLFVGGDGTTAAWSSPFNDDDSAELGPIGPGGSILLFNPGFQGWAVVDGSAHLLKLAATGGDVTCDIVILGRSVASTTTSTTTTTTTTEA